jgi:anti-sigma B factor antagonist
MRPPEFDIEIRDDGVLLVVTPIGELDVATVPAVRQALGACSDSHRSAVLDLRGVTFMDSTAVRLLIEARNGDFGERFALVAPPAEVGQVLDISGVRPMFRWIDGPEVALEDAPG